jgi:hypothetical protein
MLEALFIKGKSYLEFRETRSFPVPGSGPEGPLCVLRMGKRNNQSDSGPGSIMAPVCNRLNKPRIGE